MARWRIHWLALALGGGTVGCNDSGIPSGCEDVFDDAERTCSGEPGVCDFVHAHPDRELRWDVQFLEDLQGTGEPSDKVSDYDHKAACVERFLEDADVDVLAGPSDKTYFSVSATASELEPLCRASMIGQCSPMAGPDQCEPLSESECAADPLCWEYRGTRRPPGASCVESDAFAVCLPPVACTASPAVYSGPDGCFAFSSGCLRGVREWGPGGGCPDLEELGALPTCE